MQRRIVHVAEANTSSSLTFLLWPLDPPCRGCSEQLHGAPGRHRNTAEANRATFHQEHWGSEAQPVQLLSLPRPTSGLPSKRPPPSPLETMSSGLQPHLLPPHPPLFFLSFPLLCLLLFKSPYCAMYEPTLYKTFFSLKVFLYTSPLHQLKMSLLAPFPTLILLSTIIFLNTALGANMASNIQSDAMLW